MVQDIVGVAKSRDVCKVYACPAKVNARGYCAKHYKRDLRQRKKMSIFKPDITPQEVQGCIFVDCAGQRYARDLCASHYNKAQYRRKSVGGNTRQWSYAKTGKLYDQHVLGVQVGELLQTGMRQIDIAAELTRLGWSNPVTGRGPAPSTVSYWIAPRGNHNPMRLNANCWANRDDPNKNGMQLSQRLMLLRGVNMNPATLQGILASEGWVSAENMQPPAIATVQRWAMMLTMPAEGATTEPDADSAEPVSIPEGTEVAIPIGTSGAVVMPVASMPGVEEPVPSHGFVRRCTGATTAWLRRVWKAIY